jgi:O-antigen/teichoic acid export membrane protein
MITKIKSKIYNFLHWTEKWTQTDMIYLAKGGSWLAVGQAITMIAALLSSIAFANLLPAEIFGAYKYIFSFIGLLSIPTLGGLSTALIQAVARGEEGTLFAATKTRIRWGLLSSVGSLGLSGYYFINHNTYLTLSFLAAAIFLPLMDPLNMYTFYLNGKKNFKLITKFNIINQIIILSVTVATIWLTNNVWLIILSYFTANTIVNGIFYFLTIKISPPNSKVSAEAINYGKHLTAMNIISLIAGQLDKILIWHYLGAVNLAIYSFALAPIDQINSGVLKNTITLVMPKLSNNTPDILKKTLPKKIIKFTFLTIVAAIIYIIAAPLFYNMLFPKYTASIIYSRFYAIILAFLPFSLFTTAIVSQSQKKKLYFLSIFVSAIKIILLFALLPYFGIAGAISALILTNAVSHISNIYLFKKI